MLEIYNLQKYYGNRLVLDDLTFCIPSGEIYGLLGPNGAGKTTTINIICNLLKPDKGIIKINQEPLSEMTKGFLGVVPQKNLIYPSLTCEENLNFFAKLYGLKGTYKRKQIECSLKAVNLWERAKSPAETLSGGMERRLSIAIALVHEPQLLILDEPTTGLDIEARYEIWGLIQSLKAKGITILLTTHLMDEAQRLCQKIGILKNGRIVGEGSLNELRKVIPAKEVVVIQTEEKENAIARGLELGFTHRFYGNDLIFWLPKHMELVEIISYFDGICLDSISRQAIQLEHIYIELTQNR